MAGTPPRCEAESMCGALFGGKASFVSGTFTRGEHETWGLALASLLALWCGDPVNGSQDLLRMGGTSARAIPEE
jgi:hypothetical protein